MNDEALATIERFAGMEVLVLGEAMLDSYLGGEAGRLCREAPVPVVNVSRRVDMPGGAANAAANATALGARVRFLSVAGDDGEALLLRRTLETLGVAASGIIAEPGRRTLAKHRVLADGQMLVRFDQGDTTDIAAETEQQLMEELEYAFRTADAVIASDYGYGVLTPRVLSLLRQLQLRHARVFVADSKRLPAYREVGCTAVKPNFEEACEIIGAEAAGTLRQRYEPRLAEQLLDATGARVAALTLDHDGALILERGRLPYHTSARRLGRPSTAGAGDTFAVSFAMALAAGASTAGAADLASGAAGVVVGEEGTATCTAFELREALLSDRKYIADRGRLASRIEHYRAQGKRIVFTNGCFDILHSGHIAYLNAARELGDVLIVGLNSDESVRRLKGEGRPVNTLDDRARVLAALDCIGHVVPFAEDTPAEIIRIVHPDVFVKGGDYTEETLPEAPLVRALGGSVHILPFVEDRSTSGIIARIRENAGPQRKHVRGERMADGGKRVATGATRPVR